MAFFSDTVERANAIQLAKGVRTDWKREAAWLSWLGALNAYWGSLPIGQIDAPKEDAFMKELGVWEGWMQDDGIEALPYVGPKKAPSSSSLDSTSLLLIGGAVLAGVLLLGKK